jgi:HEAT repeat protein
LVASGIAIKSERARNGPVFLPQTPSSSRNFSGRNLSFTELERTKEFPVKIRNIRRRTLNAAFGILGGFCILGLAPSGYGKTDDLDKAISKLSDKNDETRKQAVAQVGNFAVLTAKSNYKDPRAFNALIAAALKDSNFWVRFWAVDSLSKLGTSAVEPFLAALRDSDPQVRANAASAFIKIKDSSAVEPLIAALLDTDIRVRNNASAALGALGDPRAVEPLIVILTSPSSGAHISAALALGELRDPRAVEPLIAALKEPGNVMRFTAAHSLALIGDPRAVEPLTAALSDPDPLVHPVVVDSLARIRRLAEKQDEFITGKTADGIQPNAECQSQSPADPATQTEEQRMLIKIRCYQIGTTTFKQFKADAGSGGWTIVENSATAIRGLITSEIQRYAVGVGSANPICQLEFVDNVAAGEESDDLAAGNFRLKSVSCAR